MAKQRDVKPNTPQEKATSPSVATKASRVLASDETGSKSKTAAASALSQAKAQDKSTSPQAASAASKVLSDGRTSSKSTSAAGSALSQKDKTSQRGKTS